jgi:hypothetical protein
VTGRWTIAAAVLLFGLLATANSGGYRYGVSDQAFYVPVVASAIDPSLFPRDRAVFAAQGRLWAGGDIARALARVLPVDLPIWFGALYLVTIVALGAGAIALARSLGADGWTTAAFLLLLTFRHRIARTAANSLEGYGSPRMLAFAIGLGALAAMVRQRFALAAVLLAAAAAVHPTTAGWFTVVLVVAVWWRRSPRGLAAAAGAAGIVVFVLGRWAPLPASVPVMDAAWRGAFVDKDYLFAQDWPVYAWVVNLLYPVLIVLIHRRRAAAGLAAPGEAAIVAGLVVLVTIFLATLPLTGRHVALAVQLQITRVFWLLDAVLALFVAWVCVRWASGRWHGRGAAAVVALLLVASAGRGLYLLRGTVYHPLVEIRLPDTPWNDAMGWLRAGPASWHVLADPGHALSFGPSVRLAAGKDTLLEDSKDSAMALYDRALALRVVERRQALKGFAAMTRDDVRRLATRYDLDVFVDAATRAFDLPVLYRNDVFVIYDLH